MITIISAITMPMVQWLVLPAWLWVAGSLAIGLGLIAVGCLSVAIAFLETVCHSFTDS